ncbi:DUF6344 domain-containing protein [Streptomyces sp. NPDC058001]|uniref:DUF6344 domain-containing protein n=1 Tax=Streptomyces sp. NPDC058001 TaxID=3346300 RepID=UPI0036E1AE32
MARNKLLTLWTALITAVLAVLATLGLSTTAAAATPVQQTEKARNSAETTEPCLAAAPLPARHDTSLPPTMKQRIRAEAHGSSPSCRHRPSAPGTATEQAGALEAALTTESPDPTAHRPHIPAQHTPSHHPHSHNGPKHHSPAHHGSPHQNPTHHGPKDHGPKHHGSKDHGPAHHTHARHAYAN